MTSETGAPTAARAPGGIAAPRGFRACGVHCGIKPSPALDIAVLATEVPVAAAGVFTTHPAPAAPVIVAREHLALTGGLARGVVINSGSANACTGAEGLTHARLVAAEAASGLGCPAEQLLVASIGITGVRLPLTLVTAGIRAALGTMSRSGGAAAARVIMATAHDPIEHAVTVQTSRGTFTVGGMAAGSCAIDASAALLVLLTTDAAVAPDVLRHALLSAGEAFVAMTMDDQCSMNDSLFAMASGESGFIVNDDETYHALAGGLLTVSHELAYGILHDTSTTTVEAST